MKGENIIDKLDDIKENYKYEIQEKEQLVFPCILTGFYTHFKDKLEKSNLESDFKELKEKIKKEKDKDKKTIKDNIIGKIETDLDIIKKEYDKIKIETTEEYFYYHQSLYTLTFDYMDNRDKIKGAKEAFLNIGKGMIDLNVTSYLKKEKKLISIIDKIKDLKKLLF